ncbi:MAG: hypothetical protein ABJB03_01585 [Rhodoglobus sp.]
MTKAVLNPRQTRAAILAGIFGHGLFVLGWYGFAAILALGLFALLSLIVGKAFGSLLGGSSVGDLARDFFAQFTAFFLIFAIVVAVIGLVLLLLGFIVSRAILKGGGVRRPTAVTWGSFGIAAGADTLMFFVYIAISNGLKHVGGSVAGLTPLVVFACSILLGVGIWLLVTWISRGEAVEPVEAPLTTPLLPPPPPGS